MEREGDVSKAGILSEFASVAEDSLGYARSWKARTGRPVIGSFPMNFPGELAHAAGALPMILQESREAITYGHGVLFPFYCGYTRSMVDQAAKGDFACLDAIMFGDHCVQLLGAADAIRMQLPDTRVIFFPADLLDVRPLDARALDREFRAVARRARGFVGRPVGEAALRASIALFNRNRALIRKLHAMRETGAAALTARQMQAVVKSSMIMDKAEHCARARGADRRPGGRAPAGGARRAHPSVRPFLPGAEARDPRHDRGERRHRRRRRSLSRLALHRDGRAGDGRSGRGAGALVSRPQHRRALPDARAERRRLGRLSSSTRCAAKRPKA
jgi:hypothetical protein